MKGNGAFTKITASLMLGVRDLANWGVDTGNTTPEAIRHTVASINETLPKLLAGGMKKGQIARHYGLSPSALTYHLRKIQNLNGNVKNLKTGSAATKARRAAVAAKASAKGVTPVPSDKCRIIYADPPWDYGAHAQPDYHTEQRDHYPVMDIEAICAEPVREWIEPDAVLFLWVTSPILEKSFEVVHAWGFDYKASFVWDKIKHNMGHYNSVRHELLLICTRGSCQPDVKQLFDSVQNIERREHSAKPVEFYDIIETLYTYGRRLEMYGRGERRPGWDCYGHIAELGEENDEGISIQTTAGVKRKRVRSLVSVAT